MRAESVATNLRCNQNCTYCTARRPADVLAQIQPAAVRAAIDAHLASGAKEIVLTGGEPAMRADLPALVAHAREKGAASVVLETNATLIDATRAAALAAAGLGKARVNLAGWGEALDAITRDPGGFSRTLAGMRALHGAGVELEVQAAVVRSTRALLPELPSAIVGALGPGVVRLIRVTVPTSCPDPTELLSYEEAAPIILGMESAARRAGVPVRMSPESGPPPCVFPKAERAAGLFSLTRGGVRAHGSIKPEACARCLVDDRCVGFPEAYLARHPLPAITPIAEDRLRRRLSVISTIEEQVDRELVQPSRTVDGDESIIRINFHCNQACQFCFVSTHLPAVADARVEAEIRAAAARGERIVLSGGEPTLHPRLPDFIRLAKEVSKLPVQIQTNAVRLDDPALALAIEAAGCDEAFVSLHGTTAEVSDAITDAPGTFVRTLAGLDNLARTKIVVILNFVIHRDNHHQLPEYMRLAAARWPRSSINVSFVAPSADVVPRTPALIPRYSDIRPSLDEALAEAARLDRTVVGFDSMCGIPLCLIPAAARPEVLVEIEPGYDRGEFLKTDACKRCALERHCYGLRSGYAELHGTSELTPIT
jgi:MoaA/NifB/PqqE/SkfB family radical SAM enzyme